MGADTAGLKSIFAQAMDLHAPAERAAFLDAACADQPTLRAEVESLLAAHQAGAGFFKDFRICPDATLDEPSRERPGAIIGPYKLLEQIGEGGFGVVFMAEQQVPIRRKVALKVIKPGMDTRQVIARFEVERQALALMDHPNIAKVLDAGTTGSEPLTDRESKPRPERSGVSGRGRPYFVMELVKGIPITEYCDQNQVLIRERLGLFILVCQAVQHAHQKGIIHRDIKPTNVMVTTQDGAPLVKVIDFGIAKAMGQQLTDKTLFTNFAQLIGTPLYMSPEQAALSNVDVDTRSDIYSLGVLLYELFTGTTPFDQKRFKEAGYDEICRIIREEEPPKPSTRISTLGRSGLPSRTGPARQAGPTGAAETTNLATIAAQRKSDSKRLSLLFRGELDWIVMKALEKDRNRRYETASSLARDIERYLNDEPVQACPPSLLYRFRKLFRRNKVALSAAVVVTLALVLGTVVSMWQAFRATGAELLAQNRLETLENNLYFYRIALAERELRANQGVRANELLDQCRLEQCGWEWYFLKRWLHEEPLTPVGHTKAAGGIAFSPDGQVLASASFDGTVRLWNPTSGKCLRILTGESPTFASVAFSPDSRRVAAGSYDGTVTVWDLETEQRQWHKGHGDRVVGVAFAQDSRHLISTGRDGTALIWDAVNDEKRAISGLGTSLSAVAYCPDGIRFALGGGDGRVRIWDLRTSQPLWDLEGHHGEVSCVAFSLDGRYLATGGADRTVRVWDATTGNAVAILRGHIADVAALAFSPDGRRLASGAEDNTVRIWDPVTGQEALTLRDHERGVLGLAFSPNGLRLAAAGFAKGDAAVRIWNATPWSDEGCPEALQTLTGHELGTKCLGFSPDGALLASASDDKTIRIWDTTRGREVRLLRCDNAVTSVAFSSDGAEFATCDENGTVQVRNTRTGRAVFSRRLSIYHLQDVTYSRDGRLAVADPEFVRILDATTGKELAALNGQIAGLNAVAFSPDGQCVALASDDKTVRIWEPTTNKVHLLIGHQAGVMTVAYHPGGKFLATAGADGLVIVWDATTAKETRRFRAHRDTVNWVRFSPDGRCLATASRDGTVKIWDAKEHHLLRFLRADQGEINAIAFHPDGRILASAGADGTVKTWEGVP